MAPLVSESGDGSSRQSNGERAQLFIVIGIVLALAVVALAVALVEIDRVGTEHGRDVSRDATDAARFVTVAEREGQTLLRAALREHDEFDRQSDAFVAALDTWSERALAHYTPRGAYAAVELADEPVRGTVVSQRESAPFTSAVGDSNWTVATETNAAAYTVAVDDVETAGSESFRLIVDPERSETRWLSVRGSESITITDHDGNEWTTDGRATVDLGAGTVNGDDHAVAQLLDGVQSYELRYENAARVRGTYTLVAESETATPGVDDGDETQPRASDAIYSSELNVRYESDQISYESTTTITPRANDG